MIMETLKFKVGDKVRVKSLEWYKAEQKNAIGTITKGVTFAEVMSDFCAKVITIQTITRSCGHHCYKVVENNFHWQDWMLENEVVTEEKQEVKVLNNEMETTKTKEMTQAEIFEYLNDTKILCTSTEETAKVQKKLFELGITWMNYGKDVRKNRYLLFIGKQGEIAYCSNIETWMQDINRRIEPSEILLLELKEEKPKFNPKTLRAFDKVLVRNTATDVWCARFFDRCELGVYDTTSQESWIFCIPYNEETKHLHGTTNEAPEFYII